MFNITPLHENAYELNVHFSNNSVKTFTFSQHASVKEGNLSDVFTKNGLCSTPLQFQKRDLQEAKNVVSHLQSKDPIIAVFDLKEPHTHYIPCSSCENTIAKSEELVCNFFQGKRVNSLVSNHAEKIRTQLSLDYILCEGSLKEDLLKNGGFSDQEIEHLNSNSMQFCQLAEFFMNGFKLGQSCKNHDTEFLAEKYIKPISNTIFESYKKSTVFYPSLYKNMYSVEGNFAKTLSSVFSVSGEFSEKTQITTLIVEKK